MRGKYAYVRCICVLMDGATIRIYKVNCMRMVNTQRRNTI